MPTPYLGLTQSTHSGGVPVVLIMLLPRKLSMSVRVSGTMIRSACVSGLDSFRAHLTVAHMFWNFCGRVPHTLRVEFYQVALHQVCQRPFFQLSSRWNGGGWWRLGVGFHRRRKHLCRRGPRCAGIHVRFRPGEDFAVLDREFDREMLAQA